MGYTGFEGNSYRLPPGRAVARAAWRRGREAQRVYEAALKNKYKPNNKSIEIIGVRDPALTHITTDSVPGTLTQTTFDTTSRADSAQILLTNATGASKVIIAAWIRGKPVTRLSDGARPQQTGFGAAGGLKPGASARGGYLHDKYVDYERISQDGDITFETGNNFMVTADQVNKLADYYWKLNRTKKHIYTLSLVGFQTWFEPGEWYTLQIGGAGEAEYIDSTVECFDVRCSLSAGEAPSTSVSFREVEEGWKFDSNEVARQIAAGDFSRRPSQNVVTVAAQYYSGYADYYCGATSQTEINSAIEYANSIGGAIVQLTRGTFNVTSAITMLDNVVLTGEGPGTVVKQNANDIAVVYASSVSNVETKNIQFGVVTGITNATETIIHYVGVDNGKIIGNVVSRANGNGILCDNCDNSMVLNNIVDYEGATSTNACTGIYLVHASTSLGNIIQGNIVQNIRTSNEGVGISVQNSGNRFECEVANNTINSVVGTASGYTSYGINVLGNYVKLHSNRVTECKNAATTSKTIGIRIATGSTSCHVINNFTFNNGADTGIANTNGQNFYDGGTDTQWAG